MRISIHALLAESDCQPFHTVYHFTISIHALLAESDKTILIFTSRLLLFLSTLSLRRATASLRRTQFKIAISIHALLAESDRPHGCPRWHCRNFYPRSPCGERLVQARHLGDIINFYPRSPCGERPDRKHQRQGVGGISIHALLAESDPFICRHTRNVAISIHALLAESDGVAFLGCGRALAFLSTLSLRRATVAGCGQLASGQQFLSTLSLRRATLLVFGKIVTVTDFYPRSPCGERPGAAKTGS